MTDSKAAEQPLFAGRQTHKTSAMTVKEEGGMNTEFYKREPKVYIQGNQGQWGMEQVN